MEINCQYWIDNYDLSDFSNSIANSGDLLRQRLRFRNIAKHTWKNACAAILDGYKSQDKTQQIITSTATRRQVLEYFLEFGAWSRDELNAMSNIELSALALQYIAGNYRESKSESDCIAFGENDWFYMLDGDIWTTLSN
jgi:hypothetical protein